MNRFLWIVTWTFHRHQKCTRHSKRHKRGLEASLLFLRLNSLSTEGPAVLRRTFSNIFLLENCLVLASKSLPSQQGTRLLNSNSNIYFSDKHLIIGIVLIVLYIGLTMNRYISILIWKIGEWGLSKWATRIGRKSLFTSRANPGTSLRCVWHNFICLK